MGAGENGGRRAKGRSTDQARVEATGLRRWLFRLAAAVVVPVLFFTLLELGLRVVGYGHAPGFFVESRIGGREVHIENRKFTWRFFPPPLARPPEHLVLRAVKPAGGCRIFVLGGSAARGDPAPEFGFARILELMLRERYPDLRFEVVNTGVTAINSNVVLPIARDCAERGADVFIVYLGHNEVIGPYGPGTVFAPFSSSLGVVRASIIVKATRTGQMLEGLRRFVAGGRGVPKSWAGMEMFLGHRLHAADPRLESVRDHLRENLREICRVGRRAGAEVIVCTVASNLRDCAPFASMHRPELSAGEKKKWDRSYRAAVALESSGQYAGAVRRYREAFRIDETFADLQFRLARCRRALGEHELARERYVQAREMDALRFRADAGINGTIREVAADEGVPLADAERAFEKESPQRTPGEELFYEHVHMNFRGNHLLARTVLERLSDVLAARGTLRVAGGEVALSVEQCAERLAFTGWDRRRIVAEILERMKAPPFTNRLDHAEQVARLERRRTLLRRHTPEEALDGYRKAVERAGEDWVLRDGLGVLLRKGCRDPARAAVQFRAVLRRVPHNIRARTNLGLVLAEMGKPDDAIAQYHKALHIDPRSAKVLNNLAVALSQRGETEEAVARFSEALEIRPDFPEAHNNLGIALFGRGEVEKAVGHFREAIRLMPEYANAHNNLGLALARRGKLDEAIAHFSEAVRISPDFAQARRNLERALAERGNAQTTDRKE